MIDVEDNEGETASSRQILLRHFRLSEFLTLMSKMLPCCLNVTTGFWVHSSIIIIIRKFITRT